MMDDEIETLKQNESSLYIRANGLNKHYNYNNNCVLDNLNINIQHAKIYALLGASGCGKTTLLKCLIGILHIDSGVVNIFGHQTDQNYESYRINLNKLGFMPQDTCLHNELTISETLYYFAKLYCMQNSKIKSREAFLVNLLNLPSQDRLIKHLSTGQVRRVSFACSLIHEPTILMLDEPTVGLDPILRRKIWDYLIDLSNLNQTTIIITTHYIDEARYANTVGFMRNGRIMEESKPNELLLKYNETTLEDVFYKICIKEDSTKNGDLLNNNRIIDSNQEETSLIKNRMNQFGNCISNTVKSLVNKKSIKSRIKNFNPIKLSINRVIALLYKDFIKCKRNKGLLIVQLLVPLIQITLFCLCIGKIPINLNVGYVNNDKLNAFPINVGSMFLEELDKNTIRLIEFNEFENGIKKLKNADIWSLIVIDKNFTIEIMKSLDDKLIRRQFKNKIHIYMDNTNHQISYTIRDAILIAIKNLIEKYFYKFDSSSSSDFDNNIDYQDEQNTTIYFNNSIKHDENQINYPIAFEDPVYGSKDPVFTNFMAPGIAITVIFFLSVAATAANFVLERRLGLLERSYLTGIKTIELLFSQILIYSLLLIIQIIIVLMLLFLAFKIPLKGSLVLLTTLVFFQGFSGLCYGLLLSSVCNTEESVMQLTLASFYPILLMSGIIWPIEAQPVYLSNISKFLPLTYATEAFRHILEKGWNLFVYKVALGFITTFIWTFIFLIGFLLIFSLKPM